MKYENDPSIIEDARALQSQKFTHARTHARQTTTIDAEYSISPIGLRPSGLKIISLQIDGGDNPPTPMSWGELSPRPPTV